MGDFSFDDYRAEFEADAHKVTVDGKVYAAPAKCPLIVMQFVKQDDLDGAIGALLGTEAIPALAPIVTEGSFTAMLTDLYGADVGESSASSSSSKRTGAKSRPTSGGSTASA